jgi:hypothetical protein
MPTIMRGGPTLQANYSCRLSRAHEASGGGIAPQIAASQASRDQGLSFGASIGSPFWKFPFGVPTRELEGRSNSVAVIITCQGLPKVLVSLPMGRPFCCCLAGA